MVASCSIGRPGHTLIHAVPSPTKFSLIMRAIIDFQNLSPALKDAMLTYVARLRTGRLITGLAAITLIAVGFSHFLAAYARGTTPAMMTTADPVILTIIEYIGLASTGMVALSPLIIYVVRRAVFRDFTRLIELGLAGRG
jgi:hypothetical protein